MKKKISLFLCVFFTLAAVGCNGSGGHGSTGQTGVNDVLQQGIAQTDGETASGRQSGLNEGAPKPKESNEGAVLSYTKGIDVDLTSLSSTMVYSEVYNMMAYPDKYTGKVVKMKGSFTSYISADMGKNYFACIIQDATACCAQGIEFVPKSSYSYPKDYPEEKGDITVVGVFQTYTEGEYKFCTLTDADFVK